MFVRYTEDISMYLNKLSYPVFVFLSVKFDLLISNILLTISYDLIHSMYLPGLDRISTVANQQQKIDFFPFSNLLYLYKKQ